MSICGLGSAGMDCIREAFESMMGDTATISRPTPVSNSQGGQSVTYATSSASVCSLDPVSGRELTEAMRASAESWWEIQFPVGTDVLVTDRIIIDGDTYEAAFSDEGRSDAVELVIRARKIG